VGRWPLLGRNSPDRVYESRNRPTSKLCQTYLVAGIRSQ
jgi:hypothetical protein